LAKILPCRAIIFDFDGTLADSMPFLESIGVEVMMKYYGIPREEATKRYRTTTGLPYEHQIRSNFPNHEQNEAAIAEFEKLKIDRIYEQRLFPDTVLALTTLREMGIDLFVSSSTFQPTIREYFSRRSLLPFFRDIMGYHPGFEKGADHFRYVADKYQIPMEDVIFVGDSLKDYERSKGFCRFIGVTGVFQERDFRAAHHKGFVVSQLSEVPPLVELKRPQIELAHSDN